MAKSPKSETQAGDAVLARMLKTPPQPKAKPKAKKKGDAKRSKASRKVK